MATGHLYLALIVLLLLTVLPAKAADRPNGRMQVCTQQWMERRDAGQVEAYKPFLRQCLAGLTATPVKVRAAGSKSRKTVAAKVRKPNRMKLCGARWQEMKANGTTGGQTYREFSRICLRSR